MTWRRVAVGIFRFGVGAGIVISFLVLIAVQIRQRIFRHSAEHLLADIQSLEYRRSTWTDAAKLIARWGAYGHYEGTCTAASCTYSIHLEPVPLSLERFPALLRRLLNENGNFWNPIYFNGYERLGGLMAGVQGEFIVEDGLIQRKSFSAAVDVPEGSYKPDTPDGYSGEYLLVGRVSSQGSLLSGLGNEQQMAAHPDYKIGSPQGCENCIDVEVVLSPDINPATGQSLMKFNLSCLAGWTHCLKAMDLLPFAGEQQLKDRANGLDFADERKPCTIPPEVLGRDLDDIEIVNALADWPQGQTPADGSVRVVSIVRGSENVHVGDLRPLFVGWRYTKNEEILAGTMVEAGRQYIFFDFARERPQHFSWIADIGSCGAVAYSDDTLAALKRGIRRSSRIRSEELSAGGIGWFYE